jgi:hypothetical protein
MEEESVKDGKASPASPPNCQKRLANVPHTTTAHLPKLQTKSRSSDGVVLARACQKWPSTNQNPKQTHPNAEQARPQRPGPAYARRLQGRSTPGAMQVIRGPGRQKTALAAQKQREAVLKKVGRGGTVNQEQGKENCHVNNDRQESQRLEGQIFRPRCSSELSDERMRKFELVKIEN